MPISNSFTEIERKYTVKPPPRERLLGVQSRRYEQAYIITGEREVRIRRDDRGAPSYRLAVKVGTGFVRGEVEVPVDEVAGQGLFDLAQHRIEKTRYALGGGGHFDWVLDEFHGRFEGLWLAEIELPTADTAVPLWELRRWGIQVIDDVTDQAEMKCQSIAQCRDLRHLAESIIFGVNNERVINDTAKARGQADGSYE